MFHTYKELGHITIMLMYTIEKESFYVQIVTLSASSKLTTAELILFNFDIVYAAMLISLIEVYLIEERPRK